VAELIPALQCAFVNDTTYVTLLFKFREYLDLVEFWKWDLRSKHVIQILSYSKPPLQEQLLKVLTPVLTYFSDNDMLIREDNR